MALTRRAFLRTAAVAAGGIAVGEVVRLASPAEALPVRPPIADNSQLFFSQCLRCYRCIDVCHTRAIVPAVLADGVIAWRTPKMNFHKGYCDFCNKCVDVCPTGALRQAIPEDPSTGRIGLAVIQPDQCLAYVEGCELCSQKCPYGAISINDTGKPVIDEAKCNGCGVCVYECPSLVYRAYSGGNTRGVEVVQWPND